MKKVTIELSIDDANTLLEKLKHIDDSTIKEITKELDFKLNGPDNFLDDDDSGILGL